MTKSYASTDYQGNAVSSIATPVAAADAANKSYVDARLVINPTAPTQNNVIWVDVDDLSMGGIVGGGGGGGGLDQATADTLYVNSGGDSMTGDLFVTNATLGGHALNRDTGDTRYPLKAGTGATGTWGISITGNAATAGSATNSTNATNASNANTVAGLAVHGGRNNEGNKVVRTDGNGYIQAGYLNTTAADNIAGHAPWIFGSNGDGYLRPYNPGYLSVDYANRSGTDGHVWRSGTIVMTTTPSGTGGIDVGRTVNNVVMANGDFNAHARAATCTSFGGTAFYYGNTNASAAIRINWMVS